MKLYWTMPVKVHYRKELELYQAELEKENLQMAWRYLERAHILSHPWPSVHSHVHRLMLKFGVCIKDRKEIIGQISRLLIRGVKSLFEKFQSVTQAEPTFHPCNPWRFRMILKHS